MVFKDICILVLWTKVALALEGLKVFLTILPASEEPYFVKFGCALDEITGELGYDGPLYNRFLHMTDDMLGPSPMHIKYSSYVYDRFCI